MSLPDWSCDFLITPTERFWVDMQPFLLAQGYRLRPRYDPQWKPSWLQVQVKAGERPPYPTDYEDCIESVEFLTLSNFHTLISYSRVLRWTPFE